MGRRGNNSFNHFAQKKRVRREMVITKDIQSTHVYLF